MKKYLISALNRYGYMPRTAYISEINEVLKPKNGKQTVLDLFAGCGGLSLGFEAAEFTSIGMEVDEDCCNTYSKNLRGKCIKEYLTTDSDFPETDVIIGGPPCQPFSVGGEQNGLKDSRDGFPIFVEAIRKIRPKIWLFENVYGLMYRNRWYLEKILANLENLGYTVEQRQLNAVNYGVPQNRERIIVVGHQGKFHFPKKLRKYITSGEALGEQALQANPQSKFVTPQMDEYIARYEKASNCAVPRDLCLNKPARTLTCRNLAGRTGDAQRIRLPDGRRRLLTVREAARLQSFPDWFEFLGSERSAFYQIGNAVPPLLAFHLARKVKDFLNSEHALSDEQITEKYDKKDNRFKMDEY
ncbi:Modification methylase MthTI [uncultured archaeon]|nr:Modification methylase MthTI [uncultured archaeon]